jgi:energy-coupling factor transporter transmembrane protein EcfT
MNKTIPIYTYDDLLREEQRLSALVYLHTNQVKSDIDDIKKDLQPLTKAISFVGRLTAPMSHNSLLGASVGVGAGLLAEKLAFGAAGPVKWITKLISPFLFRKLAGGFVQRFISKKIND